MVQVVAFWLVLAAVLIVPPATVAVRGRLPVAYSETNELVPLCTKLISTRELESNDYDRSSSDNDIYKD
jgi:hypothetical protein